MSEASDLYRRLRSVQVFGSKAIVNGRESIHLCSNDYLGLSQNLQVIKKTASYLREVSQCSSRLIGGNDPIFYELEKALSDHRHTEAALVYPTGYSANLGVITAVADKNTIIFSDELNHASIVDACRLSGARIAVFRHNDIAHLEGLLKHSVARKIVVTEGIFSMDGDRAKLREICELSKSYNAIVIVDDAHGDFIFGSNFSGIPSELEVGNLIDIHISSLSKGLGCFGGYVATSTGIRELLINTSRQFIYTSALPVHLCYAALIAIGIAKNGKHQRQLFTNISLFKNSLKEVGFDLGLSESQIIPIMLGKEKTATEFSEDLLKNGVFAQAVRYPTVKKGSARLRVSLTSLHTKDELFSAIDSIKNAAKKFGMIKQ